LRLKIQHTSITPRIMDASNCKTASSNATGASGCRWWWPTPTPLPPWPGRVAGSVACLVAPSEFRSLAPRSLRVLRTSCDRPDQATYAACGERRIAGTRPQRSSAIQPTRQIRVRNVAIDVAFLQCLQIIYREKFRCRRWPAALSHRAAVPANPAWAAAIRYRWFPASRAARQSSDLR
jgi:hypothetical protein